MWCLKQDNPLKYEYNLIGQSSVRTMSENIMRVLAEWNILDTLPILPFDVGDEMLQCAVKYTKAEIQAKHSVSTNSHSKMYFIIMPP